uniref:Uncharacterized protein n=1 Tax=Romanomermis culicivorax TaxID=13658 RepID=A0A915I807_ROMCU
MTRYPDIRQLQKPGHPDVKKYLRNITNANNCENRTGIREAIYSGLVQVAESGLGSRGRYLGLSSGIRWLLADCQCLYGY